MRSPRAPSAQPPSTAAPSAASSSSAAGSRVVVAAVPYRPSPSGTGSRYIDPDRIELSEDGERALFSRHVLSVQDNRRAAAAAVPTANAAPAIAKSNGSPRAAASLVPLKDAGASTSKYPPSSPSTARSSPRSVHIMLRPPSPVGVVPVDSVVTMSSLGSPCLPLLSYRPPPGRAILGATDVEKITAWLGSLARESRQYASYALYCEMLFHESSVLTRGKPVPNRLQTAIAFHCLCRATGIFSRHEEILCRICRYVRPRLIVWGFVSLKTRWRTA